MQIQEQLNNIISYISTIDISFLNNIYVFYSSMLVLSVFFVYGVFKSLPKSGFSKETTIDLVSIGIISYVAIYLFLVSNFTLLASINEFYSNQFWIMCLLFSIIVVMGFSYINKWSIFKVLDVFTPPTLMFIGFSFLLVSAFFQSLFYLISAILFIVLSRSALITIKNRFTRLFVVFRVDKSDEYSFIGGVFIINMFLVTSTAIVGILVTALTISYWFLGFLIVLLITLIFLFIKRVKKFNLIWHLQIRSSKNKNKNLSTKEQEPLKKLID